MDWLRLDRLLDAVATTDVVVATLWLGLAALTITLLVLTRTRWGQSRPLRKCAVLSLLAHLLLVGYATTVRIVASSSMEAEGPIIHISISEEAFKPREITEELAVDHKPWESFAHESSIHPSPVELARADPAGMPKLKRPTGPEPQHLTAQPALENLALDDAVQPEPEDVQAGVSADGQSSKKSAEPIRAPTAERRQSAEIEGPAGPEVARRDFADTPSLEPGRKSRVGLPSALVDQPRPVPRIQEVPSVPQPRDSLSGMTGALPPPARGSPADQSSEPQIAEDVSRPRAASGSQVGREQSDADHLRPPSLAMLGGRGLNDRSRTVSIPRESGDVGPPVLPVPRQTGRDREMPDVYRLRVDPNRSRLAERMGATAETEEAVKRALKWLADNQEPDGRWSAKAHGAGRESRVSGRDRRRAGIEADTGMTGLALLAFLASGHTQHEGGYRSTVRRGLEYLVRVQETDGGLGGRATTYAYMYCHAMATFALSEAYGMTGDANLREPVRRAIYRILGAQNSSSGGWRYYPGDPGDTSQLGWQLIALKSAELAGISMPEAAKRGSIRFLQSVSSGDYGGLAAYRPGEAVSRPMTAEALVCRQLLGIHAGHPAAREAGDFLLGEVPGEGAKNFYYWYYGTLAMYQLQGAHWERWNQALRKTLLRDQQKTGEAAGSWEPDTVWGGYGGRVYSTAMATLCLEVYYRFLPLYIEVASGGQSRR